MEDATDTLLVSAAKQLKGFERRKFLARCCKSCVIKVREKLKRGSGGGGKP